MKKPTVKTIHAVIIEDDPYARDMIAMLLTRDWRTRVVGEFGCNETDLICYLTETTNRIDVVVIDTEVPGDPNWFYRAAEIVRTLDKPPSILFTCTHPVARVLERAVRDGCSGYIIKDEILYAFASAVVWATQGRFIITPRVQRISGEVSLPDITLIMSGVKSITNFTQRESDLIRLGILFNLSQRDIADEMVISTNWVSEIMSNIYEKLELNKILSGSLPLEMLIEDETIRAHCLAVINRAGHLAKGKTLRSAPWVSTLAFHIMTAPDFGG